MFSAKKMLFSNKSKKYINYIKTQNLDDEAHLKESRPLVSASIGKQVVFSKNGTYLAYRIGSQGNHFILKKYNGSEWKSISKGCCTGYKYGWGDIDVSNSGYLVSASMYLGEDFGDRPGDIGSGQQQYLRKHLFSDGFYSQSTITNFSANALDSDYPSVSINNNNEISLLTSGGTFAPSVGRDISSNLNVDYSSFFRSHLTNNYFCYGYFSNGFRVALYRKNGSASSFYVGSNSYANYIHITEDESKLIVLTATIGSAASKIIIFDINKFPSITIEKNTVNTNSLVGSNSNVTELILYNRHEKEFSILDEKLEIISQSKFDGFPKIDNSPSLGDTPYYAFGYSAATETISFVVNSDGEPFKIHTFKKENYKSNKTIGLPPTPPTRELPSTVLKNTKLVFCMYDDPSKEVSSRSTFEKNTWYNVGEHTYSGTTYLLYSPARRLKFRLINKRGITDFPINGTISVTYRGQTSTNQFSFIKQSFTQDYYDFDFKIPFNHDYEINDSTFSNFIYFNKNSSTQSIHDAESVWLNAIPDANHEIDMNNIEVSIFCEDYFDIEFANIPFSTRQSPWGGTDFYAGHSLYLKEINEWGNLSNPPKLHTDGIYTIYSDQYWYLEERGITKPLSVVPSTLPSVFDDLSNIFEESNLNLDVSSWNVSNIKNFSGMFKNSSFNQPINNWNVSNSENMSFMFKNSSFNQDINNWNVHNVKNMKGMFEESVFNKDISNWNVSSVEDMSLMFKNSIFNQNINNWNTSNCIDIQEMFYGNIVFNQPLNQWNVEKVINLNMFLKNATSFNQSLSNWKLGFLLVQTLGVNKLIDFATNTSIDSENYQNTIIGWAPKLPGGLGCTFDFSPTTPNSNSENYIQYVQATNLLFNKNVGVVHG